MITLNPLELVAQWCDQILQGGGGKQYYRNFLVRKMKIPSYLQPTHTHPHTYIQINKQKNQQLLAPPPFPTPLPVPHSLWPAIHSGQFSWEVWKAVWACQQRSGREWVRWVPGRPSSHLSPVCCYSLWSCTKYTKHKV